MSLSFDGVDDTVMSNAIQTLGNQITVAGWMYPDEMGENNNGVSMGWAWGLREARAAQRDRELQQDAASQRGTGPSSPGAARDLLFAASPRHLDLVAGE
jgi:hypothetical protein